MKIHSYLLPGAETAEAGMAEKADAVEFVSRNKPERLTWLQDAGLGLFLHWSVDAQLGCVISHSLVGASDDYVKRFYEELPQTLDETGWDFDHLARLARLAGFRYGMLTTKHHNGFCLWPTKTTPFHTDRNLVKEYAEAFRRQGLAVGFYFSPEDFWFLRQEGLPITRKVKPYEETVMQRYRAHLKAQMTELLQEFGPVDLMFFDGGETLYGEDGISLQRYCMELAWDAQPNLLITRGAIPTPEQRLPEEGADMAWEGCITLGTAWQHQPTNEVYKSGRETVRLIMDTRAKGGTLLLNLGPDERGALPERQEDIIREWALWHFINHEAVHDTRCYQTPWEGDTCLVKAKDGSAVYAVLFGEANWKRGERREVLLSSVKAGENTRISVLGQSGEEVEYYPETDAKTYWQQKADGLHISAVNAQRIYCGSEWGSPLVLKIENPDLGGKK